MSLLIPLLILLVVVLLINQFIGVNTPVGIILVIVAVLLIFGGGYLHNPQLFRW